MATTSLVSPGVQVKERDLSIMGYGLIGDNCIFQDLDPLQALDLPE